MNNKKGFTLIEIVIVIVIIAILAAILVPNLTRWIDKAKLSALKSEADTVRNAVAAQVISEVKNDKDIKGATQDDFDDTFWEQISKNVNTTVQCKDEDKNGYVTFEIQDGGLISFTYSSDGHVATFDGSEWSYE